MSLVSSYPASAYPANSPSSDIGNASMTSTSPNSPYYAQSHHQQTVTIGEYSSDHQHQNFYAPTSGCWSWPNGTGGVPAPAALDYQQHPLAHYHQQPSPPLSYSSSAPSPDYYTFNGHQQQASNQLATYEAGAAPGSVACGDAGQQHGQSGLPPQRVVRVVKRRNTANKKERRRTMSINNAFSDLRDCIPNVPADTKLSKIKTLRLATSYISYLMAVLEAGSDSDIPFRAELGRQSKSEKLAVQQQQQQHQMQQIHHQQQQQHQQVNQQQQATSVQQHLNAPSNCVTKEQVRDESCQTGVPLCPAGGGDKRTKGRTGWPHHVWALELKQ